MKNHSKAQNVLFAPGFSGKPASQLQSHLCRIEAPMLHTAPPVHTSRCKLLPHQLGTTWTGSRPSVQQPSVEPELSAASRLANAAAPTGLQSQNVIPPAELCSNRECRSRCCTTESTAVQRVLQTAITYTFIHYPLTHCVAGSNVAGIYLRPFNPRACLSS